MAWERGYYYRVRKVRGRVVREYVGKGRVAFLAARLDAAERQARRLKAADWRRERAQLAALEAQVNALNELAELVAHAALAAAGYRRHNRGEWRRRRNDNANNGPDGPDRSGGTEQDPAARPPRG